MSGLRDPRVRDPQYLGWVAKLPCLACMVRGTVKWGVHVAHLRAGSEEHGKRPTGKAEKPSDIWTLPLCPPHHVGDIRVTRLTQHGMGELEFWAELGIDDPFQVCLDLRAIYEGAGGLGATHNHGVLHISKVAAAARRNLEGALMNEDEVRRHYAALQASGELPDVALSIKQPWSWLIVNGYKDIENRNWLKRFPKRILVHAGKGWDMAAHNMMLAGRHPVSGKNIPAEMHNAYLRWSRDHEETGGFVGVVDITGVQEDHDSEWFMGDYGYILANARPLPFLPWRGELGFFKAKVSA